MGRIQKIDNRIKDLNKRIESLERKVWSSRKEIQDLEAEREAIKREESMKAQLNKHMGSLKDKLRESRSSSSCICPSAHCPAARGSHRQ